MKNKNKLKLHKNKKSLLSLVLAVLLVVSLASPAGFSVSADDENVSDNSIEETCEENADINDIEINNEETADYSKEETDSEESTEVNVEEVDGEESTDVNVEEADSEESADARKEEADSEESTDVNVKEEDSEATADVSKEEDSEATADVNVKEADNELENNGKAENDIGEAGEGKKESNIETDNQLNPEDDKDSGVKTKTPSENTEDGDIYIGEFNPDLAGLIDPKYKELEEKITFTHEEYKITLFYGKDSGIPEDAVLDVEAFASDSYLDSAKDKLNLSSEDYIYYSRFFDIDILSDGQEISIDGDGLLVVEMLDLEKGMDSLKVVGWENDQIDEIDNDSSREIFKNYENSEAGQEVEEAIVSFEAGNKEVYGIIGAMYKTLDSQGNEVELSLYASQDIDAKNISDVEVPEEGFETIKAVEFENPDNEEVWVSATLVDDASLNEEESIALYSLEDDKASKEITNDITNNITNDISVEDSLYDVDSDATGIVVLKDTGKRHLNIEVYPDDSDKQKIISLDGMMPKEASVVALDVTDETNVEEGRCLAAYDISIMNGDEEYQPSEDEPINVEISDSRMVTDKNIEIWHIKDDGSREKVEYTNEGDGRISISASGFSIYQVVEVAEPVDHTNYVTNIGELDDQTNGVYLFNPLKNKKFYFCGTCANDLVTKSTLLDNAALYKFENLPDVAVNAFRIYLETDTGKSYLCMNNGNMSFTSVETDATIYTVEYFNNDNDSFFIKSNGYGLNMFGGESGKGFGGWTKKDNGSRIWAQPPTIIPDDELGLDGKSYGLMLKDISNRVAMMAEAHTESSRLKAKSVSLLQDPIKPSTYLYSTNDDVTEWTFHNIEQDKYYITADVDGETKYLNIREAAQGGVTLVSSPDEYSSLFVTAGTGTNSGKIRICNKDNYSPNLYNGNTNNGFGAYNDSGNNEWFSLIEPSIYTDLDFENYEAYKVSVSDTVNVKNGQQVVIYTRVWNDTDKKYEYYIVDPNGDLKKAYDSGDRIEWQGLAVDTISWEFIEHYEEGTGNPNYYFDLRNNYSGKYIAPQIKDGQIISDDKIGLRLKGRENEEYSTTITAWDESYYKYASWVQDVINKSVISGSLAKASDFYFAILDKPVEKLTTVETIDNNEHGISIKMIDYNGTKTDDGRRDSIQTDVMGDKSEISHSESELTSKWLQDGYPVAIKTGKSLSELFTGGQAANNIFLKNTYNESGYFEYDATKNFATFNTETGDFKVYDQVGTIESGNKSLEHGQFMPYNDLTEGYYSTRHSNLTDVLDRLLADDDARKGKTLYAIKESDADYHFGMELSASFCQTADGLDAWGNDMIFEFAGDDDFWLYVDDILVLDLGGIHAALAGNVNFRTGDVKTTSKTTTLREVFKDAYVSKYPDATEEEVDNWLGGIFKGDTSVFEDYSTHTMKAFYMERGAGASNLHMKFNLSEVKPGQVRLTKAVSNEDKSDVDVDYSLVQYAFQIYYKKVGSDDEILLKNADGFVGITYLSSGEKVDFASKYTPADGVEYDNVYFLNQGESVAISFPDEIITYRVVECGVNKDIYNDVTCNDGQVGLTKEDKGTNRFDCYFTEYQAVNERPSILFDNIVNPDGLRDLNIKKILVDKDGNVISASNDGTCFDFRLYMASENKTYDELELVNMTKYRVLNPDMKYCKWDAATGGFVATAYTELSGITEDELDEITFNTSPYGAISKIPAGYTIQVPNVPVGTKFKVEERDSEIPAGYKLDGYYRSEGTYIVDDGNPVNIGRVRANNSPLVEIKNKRGWGLTAEKVWSDESYTDSHDSIYMGVYLKDGENQTLVDGSVRELKNPDTSIYWYFDDINEDQGYTLDNYVIRELALSGDYSVSADGVVTLNGATATPLEDGEAIDINAKPAGSDTSYKYEYTVAYKQGEKEGAVQNSRTDIVTNTRSGGIRLRLGEWSSTPTDVNRDIVTPLMDGVFSLKLEKRSGDDVLSTTDIGEFTTDKHGTITTIYDYKLGQEYVYVLTEKASPGGYIGTSTPIEFYIREDESTGKHEVVVINPEDDGWVNHITKLADKLIADVNVYNKKYNLSAIKYNSNKTQVLEDAAFALYRQVKKSDGTYVRDYYPIDGYENLISDANGIIPDIDSSLPAGTYYLVEKSAPGTYKKLEKDILFTITDLGEVSMDTSVSPSTVNLKEESEAVNGIEVQKYTFEIPNEMGDYKALTISKTVTGNMASRTKAFSFTIELKTSDGNPYTTDVSVTDAEGNTTAVTPDSQGIISLSLSHGQSSSISSLPSGIKAIVTEASYTSEGYSLYGLSTVVGSTSTEYISQGSILDGVSGISSNADGTKSLELTLNDDTEITFTNKKAAIIPTGIWMSFFIPVILLIILFGAILLNLKRQKKFTKGV
ncbi:MAG: hypothetical protein K6E10_09585 [Eubacterium sp.]|nr:hypothetical protein [Eubacterium sp.]